MTPYMTSDGDMVDLICRRHYGQTTAGIVEQVLQANPGLADRGAILPMGITIVLPEVQGDALPVVASVKLWD